MNGSVAVDARIDGMYIIGYSLNKAGFHSMNGLLCVLPPDSSAVDIGRAVLDVLTMSSVTQPLPDAVDSPPLIELLARAGVRTWAQYARGVRHVTVGKFKGTGQNLISPRGPLFVTPHENQGPKGGFAGLVDLTAEVDPETVTPEQLGKAVAAALAAARPGNGRLAPPRGPEAVDMGTVAMESGRVEITTRDRSIFVASCSRTVKSIYVIDSHVVLAARTPKQTLGQAVIDALAASQYDVPFPDSFPTPGQAAFVADTGFPTYVEFARAARQVTVQHEFWDKGRPLIVTPYRNKGQDDGFVEIRDAELSIKVADARPDVVGVAVARALSLSS